MPETTETSRPRRRAGPTPESLGRPRAGLYKRFFAWLLSKLQRHYGEEVDAEKHRLLGGLSGTIVEIGAGAGANLGFYPRGVDLILVEPNPYMHAYLRKEAARRGLGVDIRAASAERMDIDGDTADYVVSTLVLCSVDSVETALREVIRVLKPGGSFVFLEHVAAPAGSRLRRWQRRLRVLWGRIGDGCRPDRETWTAIDAAGFAQLDYRRFEPRTLPIVRPHIAGTATKRDLLERRAP